MRREECGQRTPKALDRVTQSEQSDTADAYSSTLKTLHTAGFRF